MLAFNNAEFAVGEHTHISIKSITSRGGVKFAFFKKFFDF
jgi:hypothetical protein